MKNTSTKEKKNRPTSHKWGRKLMVGETDYYFKVGRNSVSIRSEKFSKTVSLSEVDAEIHNEYRSVVTPRMIKKYIVKNVLTGADQKKHELIEEVSLLRLDQKGDLRRQETALGYVKSVSDALALIETQLVEAGNNLQKISELEGKKNDELSRKEIADNYLKTVNDRLEKTKNLLTVKQAELNSMGC